MVLFQVDIQYSLLRFRASADKGATFGGELVSVSVTALHCGLSTRTRSQTIVLLRSAKVVSWRSFVFVTFCPSLYTGVLPFRLQEQLSVQQNPNTTGALLTPQSHRSRRPHVSQTQVNHCRRRIHAPVQQQSVRACSFNVPAAIVSFFPKPYKVS